MGIQNLDPRRLAKKISSGELENQHIGKHTVQTIQQEIFSLKNTNPMFRGSKWKKRYAKVKDDINKNFGDNKIQRENLHTKLIDAQKRMEY